MRDKSHNKSHCLFPIQLILRCCALALLTPAFSLAQSAAVGQDSDSEQRPVRVGTAPTERSGSNLAAASSLFEQPGILTGKGTLVLEPSIAYSYSSSNRVALVGYTVIPSLLIGLVDVREVKRNTLTGALGLRYGLSSRLELEAKLPYVYRRDDTISREIFTGSSTDSVFRTSGKTLGDAEVGARYQINQPTDGLPYLVGSLRFKARTGKDPFEVVTDCASRCVGNTTGTGLPLELPTGSGFYSLQPGLTWLLPSDPAVFFGGISYTHSFKRSNITRLVLNGEREPIGSVEPGGVIGLNFGMGLSLNDKTAFSMGFDLNSVGRTQQNGTPVSSSVRTQLASLLLGYSYRVSPKSTVNLALSAGLTRDTPDLSLSLRLPFSF
ncbi:MAG: acetate kinase [Betaproteobacteria bacterium]